METRREMAGIRVGDKVRATGGKATVINGVVAQIDTYRGFLVADLGARVEPEWYSRSSLSKNE